MVERLPSLPEMQSVIDALTDVYGEHAIPTYSEDGTTCLILVEPGAESSSMYVSIVQIDLATHQVTTRELAPDETEISTVII